MMVEVVSINSPGATAVMAHLLEFDSTHGHFDHPITYGDDWMDVGKGKLIITHERDPSVLPHGAMDIDIVLECSGKFNSREKASTHLSAGDKKGDLSQLLPLLSVFYCGLRGQS